MSKRRNSYNQDTDFNFQTDYVRDEYVNDREEDFDRKYRERNARDSRKERRRQKEVW